MERVSIEMAPAHSIRYPETALVSVLFGERTGGDLGMLRVMVPPGRGMTPHRHNGSDVILLPLVGTVRITKGEESVDIAAGDALLIQKDEAVSLSNLTQDAAELIVAVAPINFVSVVETWPVVEHATSSNVAGTDDR